MELPGLSEASSEKSSSASPSTMDRLFGDALPLLGRDVYPGGGDSGSGSSVIESDLLWSRRSRISPIDRRMEGIVGK